MLGRNEVKEGILYKCPNCGELLDAFVAECPSCGYELRGAVKTSAVHELSLKLEEAASNQEREELISNFYIPNTKEDIYEFVILASSNIKAGGLSETAWSSKLEQAYQKACIVFEGSKDFEYVDKLYKEAIHERKTKAVGKAFKSHRFLNVLPLIIGLLMAVIGYACGNATGDGDSVFYIISLFGIGIASISGMILISKIL